MLKLQMSNYCSFREDATLSLYKTAKPPKGVAAADWKPVMPVLGIFGANASGKSTVYNGIQMVGRAVADSYANWRPDSPVLPIVPFILDADSFQQPTEFSIEFQAEGLEYQYGFSSDMSRFLTEYLYVYKTAHRTVLFERGMDGDVDDIKFGASFRGSKVELKAALEARPNALTLSVAGQVRTPQLLPAFNWLTKDLICYDSRNWEREHEQVKDLIAENSAFNERLVSVLSKADLGIVGLEVKEDASVGNYELINREGALTPKRKSRSIYISHRIATKHNETDQDFLQFPMQWESQGTKAFLSLVSVALRALTQGATLVVDELDSSLHSVLSAELISMFEDDKINRNGAQLIFTTHDVALLSKGTSEHPLLSRDQIYFVEKDRTNASHLIALTEYAPRNDENIMRGYLMGRYGGIPSPSFVEDAVLTMSPDLFTEARRDTAMNANADVIRNA